MGSGSCCIDHGESNIPEAETSGVYGGNILLQNYFQWNQLTNDSADPMTSVDLSNQDDLIMVIFGESSNSEGLLFVDKRPSHFPPAIDIFLWGALSTRVREAIRPFACKRLGALIGYMLLMYLLILVPLLWPSMFGWVWSGSYYTVFFIYVVVVVLTVLAVWVAKLPCVDILHRAMDAVVDELAPEFQKVGYNITYEKQESCFSLVTFIRFTPCTSPAGGVVVDMPEFAQKVAVDDRRRRRRFRVAVFGFGQSIFPLWTASDEYTLLEGRPPELQPFVDKFTWGAVSTELRPLTARDLKVRRRILALLIVLMQLVHLLPGILRRNNDLVRSGGLSWLSLYLLAVFSVFLILFFSGNLFERFILKRCLGQDILHQMQKKVQELSPLVEERSGYSLTFQIEQEGCCSTGGYIRFENRYSIDSAAVVTTIGQHLTIASGSSDV